MRPRDDSSNRKRHSPSVYNRFEALFETLNIDTTDSSCTYTPLYTDLKHLTKTIHTWLDACTTSHELCVLATPRNALPTRLIDVGPPDCSRPPRLYVPTHLNRTSSARLDYIALSYCWGSTQHSALTTSNNLAERLKGIEIEFLPKTIRDAILMTRELGFKYLWVDALCIIQPTDGNSGDWDVESLCMGVYYQHAILTFAAAVGDDSSDGLWREESVPPSGRQTSSSPRSLFTPRSREARETMRLTKTQPNWRRSVQRSTLRGRGWALQELILSSRVVYWTNDGLYWDCCCSIASESKPHTLSFNEYDQLDPVREMRLQLARARDAQNVVNALDRWYGIVAHYSCLGLSYTTDILPAISGIAKTVQQHTHEETQYAAGIWIHSRDSRKSWFDLAWRVASNISRSPPATKRKKNASYTAPSWSWASADAPVIYPDGGRQQSGLLRGVADPFFEISGVKLHLSGDDTMGQLRNGKMCLRGSMPVDFGVVLEATPADPHHWFEQREIESKYGLTSWRPLFQRTSFYFDEEIHELDNPIKIDCLVIGRLGGWHYGIVLEAVSGFDKRFRRIGVLQRHETNPFDLIKEMTIELV